MGCEFVRDGGDQFSHRADPARMSKIRPELFSIFAIFNNVREGSVPSNNGSMLVPKWYTAHQKPPIFPVSGETEPRLVFENLSGCNRDAPLLVMAHKILVMDRTLPTCS